MSADSLEIRIVKLESDVRRIEAWSERFERIDKALVKLTELAEGNQVAIKLLIATAATKEELHELRVEMKDSTIALQREFTIQTRQFIASVAVIAGLAMTAAKMLWP